MTSPQQTTSPESRPEPVGPAPGGARWDRVLGATAIVLATSMLVQNVMFGWAGAPGYGDPIADVLVWHQDNRLVVAVAVGQEALHAVLLLGFLVGLHGLVLRRGGAGADWSRLAIAGGAAHVAVLAVYAVAWDGAVLAAEGLVGPDPAFELAWQLHAAAFALALPALGATVVGAALAAHASGMTPEWQRLLAVVGGGLLVVAGTASLAIADGSPLLFVGLPGLVVWIMWLLATGVRLARGRTERP